MECPYCGAELACVDEYGTGIHESFYGTASNGIHYGSTYEKSGDIYKCPHTDGFESKADVMSYLNIENENSLANALKGVGVDSWEEVVCESSVFNGHFYTNEREDLNEGYPC